MLMTSTIIDQRRLSTKAKRIGADGTGAVRAGLSACVSDCACDIGLIRARKRVKSSAPRDIRTRKSLQFERMLLAPGRQAKSFLDACHDTDRQASLPRQAGTSPSIETR